jgi:hypothetical protein
MNDQAVETRREQVYRLLPLLYQVLDSERVPEDDKGPLRELLSVIGEQVNLLEDDLARWYDNWFIETCEDWVVPYLGDLVGYESAAKELNTTEDPESPLNRAVVFPRREVADTIALRRRKGTLAILEELSRRIVGWPARAVAYRRMTAGSASLNHLRVRRSSTVDFRNGGALALLDTAFDELPRTVDIRRINSHRTQGRHNLPAVGLFVCRRKLDSATIVPTRAHGSGERRTFDVQGLAVPLHILPAPEPSPETIAEVMNLPVPLTRRLLRRQLEPDERLEHDHVHKLVGASAAFYGIGKSVFVVAKYGEQRKLISAKDIFVTDLSTWKFEPSDDECHIVALDPELGRLAFHPDHAPDAVWTTYHYGRAAFLGGGEYDRRLNDVAAWQTVLKAAGGDKEQRKLTEAITKWKTEKPAQDHHTVIEIGDNEEHSAEFDVKVPSGHTLEIRAANRFRPLLRVPDTSGQEVEKCHITGLAGSRLILDGLLFGEGEIQLDGEFSSILIRHCTFTPGKTHLVIKLNDTDIRIEHSIVGAIVTRAPDASVSSPKRRKKVDEQDVACPPTYNEPVRLSFYDSLLDGRRTDADPRRRDRYGSTDRDVILSGADHWAHAVLTAVRTTVFGEVDVQGMGLIENSIFLDCVRIRNCLTGCVRFSYVAPESCTPPQFHCQPSLAVNRAESGQVVHDTDLVVAAEAETLRVRPRFISTEYRHPDYGRLTDDCAAEIARGADDEAEMGVYHNEFFSQRATHFRQRLEEFIPAGNDAAIIFET